MGTQLHLLLMVLLILLQLSLMNYKALAQRSKYSNETAMTKPGCPFRCRGGSNITIPYPFGIGADCARDETFIITCNNSFNPPRPFISGIGLEVLLISLQSARVDVENPQITSRNRTLSSNSSQFSRTYDVRVSAVLYWTIPGTCNNITWDLLPYSSYGYVGTRNSCSLNSLCQPSEDFQNNATQFSKGSSVTNFACVCKEGFEGNPYIPDGYINECEDQSLNHCSARCENYQGGYRCICDPRYERNWFPTGQETANNSKYKVNVIIGTCTGFGAILFFLGLWWMYKLLRKRKKMKLKQKFFKRNGGLLLQQQLSSGEDGNIEKTRLFSSKELEKATDYYNENRILGHGGQGTVYKGMLTDGRIVAVKKSTKVDEGQLNQFINEVAILSQINHRNIVKLHGCCLETEVPLLVYEFIPNGTLLQYIQDENEDFPLTWDVRLRIVIEVATALSYLHSSASFPIYHRDIKSANILLDDKYRSKVADFGTSRSIAVDQTHLTTRVCGTLGYLDPEYFQSGQFTEKSDVYSFAIVLIELLTGQKPISSTRSDGMRSLTTYFILAMEENRIFDILDSRIQNEGKKHEIIRVANLARRCSNLNGRQRPIMKQVAMELEAIRMSNAASTIQQHYEEVDYDINEVQKSWETASTSTSIVHTDV
ncbi:hypothetical protein LguiB_005997 [Lonicera macranthoides]